MHTGGKIILRSEFTFVILGSLSASLKVNSAAKDPEFKEASNFKGG